MPRITLTPVRLVFLIPIRSAARLAYLLFPRSCFLFCLTDVTWRLFTDVLESVPLLSCVSTNLHIPKSGKHWVSQMRKPHDRMRFMA